MPTDRPGETQRDQGAGLHSRSPATHARLSPVCSSFAAFLADSANRSLMIDAAASTAASVPRLPPRPVSLLLESFF